ncbi:ecto-ADP-ribosyltransferase 5-like [Chanos chanos]|uniref:NAD(P)(+)--arginine ADP-ribosyltransferase n=1 Tax=Chanos chanos TaxID=29144 RepID=A0A6J2WHB6_CHACN|nr:ecto-ADP-ribosyltransferase 5-like [Chanos chanos]
MNLELDSVDDQYTQCREEMLKRVTEPGGLLDQELRSDNEYYEAWKNAKTCRTLIPGVPENYSVALAVFTSDFNFYDRFNKAVRMQGASVDIYKSKFPFKSLHFLLTDVLRMLNTTDECADSISGSYTNFGATKVGTQVRLEHFHWVSPFMNKFCYTIYKVQTCRAYDVSQYSCFRDIEAIISPSELFEVTAVDTVNNESQVLVSLVSKGIYRKHHCSFLASLLSCKQGAEGSQELSETLNLYFTETHGVPDPEPEAKPEFQFSVGRGPVTESISSMSKICWTSCWQGLARLLSKRSSSLYLYSVRGKDHLRLGADAVRC